MVFSSVAEPEPVTCSKVGTGTVIIVTGGTVPQNWFLGPLCCVINVMADGKKCV